MTSPIFYMPTRFDSAAPRFDEHDATTLLPFFDDLETLFARARISDDQEKKLHARRYASDCSYDLFSVIPQFATPATFSDFKDAILDLWPGSRNRDRFRRADMESLVAKRQSAAITSEEELAEFFRAFLTVSEKLIALRRLCALEQRRALATAFDAPLWSAIAHRLDILDCDRDPELAPAIHDVYEAARYVLRSRKARAHAAPPATFVPAPARIAPSPAPVATASPPSIASAPVVPVVVPPCPIAVLAPRPPAVAIPPPSFVAHPAQAAPSSRTLPAPSHVASHPAFAALKPALAPATAVAPRLAKPTSSPLAPVAPSRIVSHYLPGLPRTPRITPQQSAPAPAPRQRSVEEIAKILAAFTWQPPHRVAPAPEPSQDRETFADVFASIGDPFKAFEPSPDRVARAQRIYSTYASLPVSFDEFLYGTTPASFPEPCATSPISPTSCPSPPSPPVSPTSYIAPSPASSPLLPIAYLPPSSPLFASLPKPRPRPRRPPRTVLSATPAPSLHTASSPSRPTILPSPSLPTLHPSELSFGELLAVAPSVRDLLRTLLDALEPASHKSRPLSRPHDASDLGGVAFALHNVSSTPSRLRCDREAPRPVVAFALCAVQSRYEPAPAFATADPASRPRQSPSPAHALPMSPASPLSHAPSPMLRSSPSEPTPHASVAKRLSEPAIALRHVITTLPSTFTPAPAQLSLRAHSPLSSSPAPSPALESASRSPPDDLATPRDASATPRPTRSSSQQPATATTPEPQLRKLRVESSSAHRDSEHRTQPLDFTTTPAHLEAQLRSDSAPRHRIDSLTPRATSSSPLATCAKLRSPGHVSAALRIAKTAPAHPKAQLSSDSAPRHRIASITPPAASLSPPAICAVSRSPDHVSAASRIAKTVPRPRIDGPALCISAASCPEFKAPLASRDALSVLELAQCVRALRDRDLPLPATPSPRDCVLLARHVSTAPRTVIATPRHRDDSATTPAASSSPRENRVASRSPDFISATPQRFARVPSLLRWLLATLALVFMPSPPSLVAALELLFVTIASLIHTAPRSLAVSATPPLLAIPVRASVALRCLSCTTLHSSPLLFAIVATPAIARPVASFACAGASRPPAPSFLLRVRVLSMHRQRTSPHLGDSLGVPLGDSLGVPLGDSLGVPLGDLATCSTATSRLRLRYLGDFDSALAAASRQGSRSRKTLLPPRAPPPRAFSFAIAVVASSRTRQCFATASRGFAVVSLRCA